MAELAQIIVCPRCKHDVDRHWPNTSQKVTTACVTCLAENRATTWTHGDAERTGICDHSARSIWFARVSALSLDIAAQNTRIAAVEALAREWETEGHAVLPVRNATGQDYADDLRAALSVSDPGQDKGACECESTPHSASDCCHPENHWPDPGQDKENNR